jgi:hypothetical protein
MKPFSVLQENISTPTRDINSAIQRRAGRDRPTKESAVAAIAKAFLDVVSSDSPDVEIFKTIARFLRCRFDRFVASRV